MLPLGGVLFVAVTRMTATSPDELDDSDDGLDGDELDDDELDDWNAVELLDELELLEVDW
jgi:hypothetical protein